MEDSFSCHDNLLLLKYVARSCTTPRHKLLTFLFKKKKKKRKKKKTCKTAF